MEPLDKIIPVNADLSDFDLDDLEDLEIETPDDDESSAAAKLRALMKKYPALENLTRGADGSRLASPADAMRELAQLKEELTSRDVSSFEKPGYAARPAFLEVLEAQTEGLREVIRRNFDASEISDFELDFYSQVIIYNNLTGSFQKNSKNFNAKTAAAGLVSKYGISVTSPDGVAVRTIKYPAVASGDSYRPAGAESDYQEVLASVDTLNEFFSSTRGALPPNFDPNAIAINFIDNPGAFADMYKMLGGSRSRNLAMTRVLGTNFIKKKNGFLGPQDTLKDLQSDIIFNLSLMRSSNPEFGTSAIRETIFHEYAHSIHRAVGLGFISGNRALSSFPGSNLTAEYRQVKKEFVTSYGETDAAEHFSDSFSKYLASGEASPTWLAFMKRIGIIKD